MNVVLYMRYSSDRQTEQSIEGQRRVCREFCERQGYTVVKEYVDRATSAFKDIDKRVAFAQMLKDSDKQLWEGVVVYKLDRFARNRYDSATYKAKLKKNGVKLISATENISDSPEGIILESVLEGMAEFYSQELSQKIRRGLFESANKCNSVGGQLPLGYKIENKKLVIDEPNAQIVREAFELYAKGTTVAQICEIFNSKGYLTTKGVPFNKNSFSSIFKNERYIGVYKFKDIRIEGGVPAIVDKEVYEAVQKRRKTNAQAPARGKAKVNYLLAQKLFCGHCGSVMTGDSGTSRNGTVYNYYSCANRKRKNGCTKTPLRKDVIEKLVVADALKILTPDRIAEFAEIAVEQNMREIEADGTIPALQAELDDLDMRINNIVKTVEQGVASTALSKRLNELEKQRNDIENRLKDAKAEVIVLDEDEVKWWLMTFTKGNIEDEDFRRHIIDMFVNSVTVWDEPDGYIKITSVYNLTKNNSFTFRFNAQDPPCSDLNYKLPPIKSASLIDSQILFFYLKIEI